MKYRKIALFLILLTSSVFASSSFGTDEELKTIACRIRAVLNEEMKNSKIKKIELTRKFIDENLKSIALTETQKVKLIGIEFPFPSSIQKPPILTALKEARAKDISDAADFILDKSGANGVSSKNLSDYESKLTPEQYAKIEAFEQGSGGFPLQKDEIEDFLLNGNLPTPLSPVDKILKVANGGKVSLKEWNAYGCDLNENQYEAIKKYEKYSVRLLVKDDLENFILKGLLPDLETDEKKKAILDLSNDKVGEVNGISDYATNEQIEVIKKKETESNSRIDEDLLEKILKASNDELEELAKPVAVPSPSPSPAPSPAPAPAPSPAPSPAPAPAPKTLTQDEIAAEILKYVKDGKINTAHKAELESLKLTTGQVDKLFAETGLDANKIKAILNAPDATPAATPKPLTEAEIAKEIFAKYVKDGKINSDDVSKKAIMALGITSAQFDKLVAIDKIDSVTKIQENLKATPPASATTKINIDFAAILKIAAANAGKIVEANRDALKLLGLSAAQIDLLLTASGLDSVDKIEKLLITGTEPSNNAKTKTTEIKAETAEKGDGANGPWYTSGWVLGISGILIISAIGGGAYIITRKSNETDL
jgi:hypothetical protein